jgi:hypothetical protein
VILSNRHKNATDTLRLRLRQMECRMRLPAGRQGLRNAEYKKPMCGILIAFLYLGYMVYR